MIKAVQHIPTNINGEQVPIEEIRTGFILGSGTSDGAFILKQLQGNCLLWKKNAYFSLNNLFTQ